MTDSPVLLETDDRGVATVTLNRPARNNAYDRAMLEALVAGCESLGSDADVRVVVIRGAGRHFQAGADLEWLREVSRRDARANLDASRLTANAVRRLNELPKPTVALVHGACIGGGTGIAASCDVVIADADASFAISEARWGMVASIIFPQLNDAIGVRNVRRYALSCERFGAATAQAIGLVHEVCEVGGLDLAAAPVIEALLHAAPGSIAATKLGALRCAGALLPDSTFEALVEEHAAKRRSTEAAEGLASFVEKRDAAWYAPA